MANPPLTGQIKNKPQHTRTMIARKTTRAHQGGSTILAATIAGTKKNRAAHHVRRAADTSKFAG
ncbi:MAG: hypothetical protein WCG97_02850 [bacterium]